MLSQYQVEHRADGFCLGDHVLAVGDVIELRIRDEFRRGHVVISPDLAGWGVVFDGGGACGLVEGFVARLISAQSTSPARESLGGDSAAMARSHPKLSGARETRQGLKRKGGNRADSRPIISSDKDRFR
jgi:hypothetical protein